MSRAELIYPIRRNIEKEFFKINKDPFNKEILTRYYKVRNSQVRPATILFEFGRLNVMSRLLGKKLEDVTVQDMEDLVFKIDQMKISDNTKNKFRKVLKAFYRWMRGCSKGEYPPEVKWITLKRIPLVTVRPDDLLTYEECLRITEFAKNLRDKALFQCLLDAGCRIGEILTAKVGEVEFNDNGAIIYSEGKTGNEPCILTWSSRILGTWLNNHPFRDNKDAPLWPILGRSSPKQVSYDCMRMKFKECARKAGHRRRVWLHLLKHVSSTEDARNGMPDSFRRYKHHWTQNSKMPQVYEHLSKSIIHKIQKESWKLVGVSKSNEEQAKPINLLKTCRRCSFENPRDSGYCNRCGFSFDENRATGAVVLKSKIDLLNKLMEDPEKLDKLLALIES